MTSFDYYIGEKTEVICDWIWVIVPSNEHTLSLNNIIASIQSGTEKTVHLRKMMKIQVRPRSPNCVHRTS